MHISKNQLFLCIYVVYDIKIGERHIMNVKTQSLGLGFDLGIVDLDLKLETEYNFILKLHFKSINSNMSF